MPSCVLAQVQIGHVIQFTDGQVAHALAPVELQGALGLDAGDRCDGGADTQVAAVVVAFDLGQEDALLA